MVRHLPLHRIHRSSFKLLRSNIPKHQPAASQRRWHVNRLLCLSICLYLLAVAYWVLDIVCAQQELLVFLPEQLGTPSTTDAFKRLTEMLGTHWYAQTVLQILIVSGSMTMSTGKQLLMDTVDIE